MSGNRFAAKPKVRPSQVIVALAGVALTAYWGWTYGGPYQWLAEIQLHWANKYDPEVTFVLTLAAVVIPLLLLQSAAAKLIALTSPDVPPESGGTSAPAIETMKPPAKPVGANGLALILVLIIGGIGVALAAVGDYEYRRGRSAGARVDVDAADCEAGKLPAATWLAVRGKALQDSAIGVKEGHTSPRYYIPVISPQWKPGGGVGLYLESSQTNIAPSNFSERMAGRFGPPGPQVPEIWEGMTTGENLPGLVRTRFEQTTLKPASRYLIVEWGKTPSMLITDGRDMMIAGGIVAAFGLLVGGAVALIARLRRSPRPEQFTGSGPVIDR